MGQALYRKYRSKSLSEIVGQDHITTALSNSLAKGTISHAYLFTGPRGVGKTSIARILAYEVNGLEYNDQSSAIDIIEIDAASNRRIDEIRDLRDKVHNAPASAKYKVYIIDEVHMLTKEAFNALLKTLEEPPAHAIFILATTESHKLPETIVSRTQRYSFRPIDPAKAVRHLRDIAAQEKIDIDDQALAMIAKHGAGSFRDSISLLDQVANSGGAIEASDVQALLGIPPAESIERLYRSTAGSSPGEVISTLNELEEQGYDPSYIAKHLSSFIRSRILNESPEQALTLTSLLKQLIDVPASSDPLAYLEITLLEANLTNRHSDSPTNSSSGNDEPSTPPKKEPPRQQPDKPENPAPAANNTKSSSAATKRKPAGSSDQPLDEAWSAILAKIKQKHNTLYSVLRMSKPDFGKDQITFAFRFPFHQRQVNDAKNQKILADLLQQELGRNIAIHCALDKNLSIEQDQPDLTAPAPKIDTISNIFGNVEVLES